MTDIFISYRRTDLVEVGRTYDKLVTHFPKAAIFLDRKEIRPGERFPLRVREAAAEARVMLVMLSAGWASARDPVAQTLRIERPDDWMRQEIEICLGQGGRLIPVLLEGAAMPEPAQLPESIRPIVERQAVRLVHEFFDESCARLHEAVEQYLAETAQWLAIPYREWSAEKSPPAALLRAEFNVVPFTGRAEELEKIRQWRDQPAPLGVALVTGVGGRGKTRLAIEACYRGREAGWRTGFASLAQLAQGLSNPDNSKPVLVVIDYAESDPAEVIGVLSRLVDLLALRQQTLRLVLLARSAGEWWETVRSRRELTDLLHHPKLYLRMPIRELAQTDEERIALLALAREHFRRRLGGGAGPSPSSLTAVSNEALTLCAQALLAELGDQNVASESDVFDYLLSRERRFWSSALAAAGLGAEYTHLFEQLVAVATFGGGTSGAGETTQLLRAFENHSRIDAATRESFRSALLAVYGTAGRVEPLQPDKLGEFLMSRHATAEIIGLASFRNRV
jgi:hypothetical protein